LTSLTSNQVLLLTSFHPPLLDRSFERRGQQYVVDGLTVKIRTLSHTI
jgi:hypothetical protein